MTIDPKAAAACACEIQMHHDQLRSWRKVSELHYPDVPPGTLNRIAKSGGAYLPKDRKALRSLGLVGQRRQRSRVEKAITKMARETRKAVLVIDTQRIEK